jgi:hypothetical protein
MELVLYKKCCCFCHHSKKAGRQIVSHMGLISYSFVELLFVSSRIWITTTSTLVAHCTYKTFENNLSQGCKFNPNLIHFSRVFGSCRHCWWCQQVCLNEAATEKERWELDCEDKTRLSCSPIRWSKVISSLLSGDGGEMQPKPSKVYKGPPLSVHQDFPAQHRNRRRSCNDYWNVTICLVLSAGSTDLWLFSVEILLISDHKKWHHTFSYILNPKFFPRNLMSLEQGRSVSACRSLYPCDNLCSETEGELCWGCIGSFLISDRFCTNAV